MKLLSKQDLMTLVWTVLFAFGPAWMIAYHVHTRLSVFLIVAFSSIASFACGSYVAHQNYTKG